jgi:hypothetical protein
MTTLIRFLSGSVMACVCAAVATAAAVPAAHAAGLPGSQNPSQARYVCGGIGSDESGAMRAAMKDYPLSVLFARTDGAYLADVDLSITDALGTLALEVHANGPICLIDLPAGKYIVDATTDDGAHKRRAVTVGAAPKTADFRFE